MNRLRNNIIIISLLLISAVIPEAHAASTINATLHKSEIAAGESTQLTVTLSTGTDVGKPLLPDVKGLRFIPRGQSTNMQFINGRMSTTVTFVYEVDGEEEGVYTIPPIQIRLSGHIIETDPMTLTVTGSSSGTGQTAPPSSGPGTFGFGNSPPPTRIPGAGSAGQPAVLSVRPAKTTAYAGELVPVEITASFAEAMRVTLNSQPSLSGGAFTVQNPKGEPQESREVYNGRTYTVLTWKTAISAAKDGTFPVTGELAATFLVRDTMRMRQNPFFNNPLFDNDFFDQDLFDNFFGGLKEKSVTLKSNELYLRILPLPEEGRPSGFNGAIGSFSMTASSSPAAVRTGDPVTLRVRISGSGNFDRVSKPSLETDENWKTYNPEASFKPLDAIGLQGEKYFEQVLIPQSPDVKEIPPLVFSWFDPVQRKYHQIKSDPMPISVTGPAIAGSQAVPSSPSPSVPKAGEPPASTEESLAPIQIESGPQYASLSPVFEQSWYLQAGGFVLFLIVLGISCRAVVMRRMSDPGYARRLSRQIEIDATFQDIEKSLHEADTRAFLLAGRKAAQLMLADKWGLEPEAITISDIQSRGMSEFPETKKIFELSDAVSFSGHSLNVEQLKEIFKAFKDELRRVK